MCNACQSIVNLIERNREVTEESRALFEESRRNHLSLEIRQQQKENEEED